jgi:hypothetical protein
MSDDEREMVDALAARDGVTASDVVRMLIRRAHAEMLREDPPPRGKARRR